MLRIDRENITKSVGVAYILLGIYYAGGSTTINKQSIASISISAFLFVLSDFTQIYSEKFKKDGIIYKVLQRVSPGLTTGAILALIIFPFINARRIDEFTFDIIGTTLSFITVGISIYLIAKRNEKRDKEYFEKLLELNRINENINEAGRRIADSYGKKAREIANLKNEIKILKDQVNKKEKNKEKEVTIDE